MKFARVIFLSLVITVAVFLSAMQPFGPQSSAQEKRADSKPKPSASFEIKLPAENDASYQDGQKRVSSRTGYPAAVYSETYKAKAGTPEAQAREYLGYSKTSFGLSDNDIQNLKLHAIRSEDGGHVVRLRQMWKGLPVNGNAEITIHIGKGGIVDFVMNGLQYGIALDDVRPVISAEAASAMVLAHLGVSARKSGMPATELMVLRHLDRDYLVHRVYIRLDEPVGEWEAYVDAKTGSLLKVEDIGYNHRSKAEARRSRRAARAFQVLVAGTGNVFAPDPLTTATQPYGGAYVDGSDANAAVLTAQLVPVTLQDITLTGGVHSLTGPYAQIVDFEAPFKGLFTQASADFSTDRNADTFEAVMCYYHIDLAMRYLNVTLGVPVMPFQYAGGVKVDPSGFNGADNSHYLSGSGQLGFGEGGVDDAEDADVIWHELGHGLHHWITSGGLSQVNGLSEGSGDYWAGSYSRFRGFWPPGTGNTAYNWTFNWDGHNPFWQGRILNYAATYPGGLTGQIHTDGQIWATVNMKIWDDIGRERADKAFWRGLALTNGSSNQNDAANAVLSAATTMGYTLAERLAIYNRYSAAGYTLTLPTASGVSLSGRVLTAEGRAIRGAVVTITDNTGAALTAITGPRGNYRFDDLAAGETYVVNVASRRFNFDPRILTLTDNVTGFDITPGPIE